MWSSAWGLNPTCFPKDCLLFIGENAAKQSPGVTQCKVRQAQACHSLPGASCVRSRGSPGKVHVVDSHHMPQHKNPAARGDKSQPSRRQYSGWGRDFVQEEWVWCMGSEQVFGLVGKSNSMHPGEVTLRLSCSPDFSGPVLGRGTRRASLYIAVWQTSHTRPRALTSITHGCPGPMARGQDLPFLF